jgi:plastocyanin
MTQIRFGGRAALVFQVGLGVFVCVGVPLKTRISEPGPRQAPPDTTIVVRANSSTLEFDPPAIAAKAGARVRLRFVNSGTLPHNFVLVKDEDDIDALAAAASKAGGDYVPLTQKEKMIAYSTLASPGQTVELVFVVPPAGEYTYVCLLSGHSTSMLGTLRALR